MIFHKSHAVEIRLSEMMIDWHRLWMALGSMHTKVELEDPYKQ